MLQPLASFRPAKIANIVGFAEIESTNDFAKLIADRMLADDSDLPPSLFLSWNQTAGRGRSGHKWTNVYGSLALSVLMPWPEDQRRIRLPLSFGVAFSTGLARRFGIDIRMKWPNDLLVGKQKLAGILSEGRLNPDGVGYAIVGIGINVWTPPEALRAAALPSATSLSIASPRIFEDIGLTLQQIVSAVDEAIDSYPEDLPAAFERVSAHQPGDRMTVNEAGRWMVGRYLGLTEDGFLRLDTYEGEELILSGDVVEF